MSQHPVWDVPTRLFHWLLVIAVICSWVSHEIDNIDMHLYSGYTVLVLVVFRLAWGFIGSIHSRFSDFIHGPGAVLSYWRGETDPRPGHNPAGGWSVLLLLTLLLAQALSGLFNSDGLMFDGPLHHLLDGDWQDQVGELHEYLFWGLSTLISIHVLAVLHYQFNKREDLIRPMFSGGSGGHQAPRPHWLAPIVLAVVIAALVIGLSLVPEPELPW